MNWEYIGMALLHAMFVIVGVYVAVNTRLTRLETKMDAIWDWFLKNGKK